LVERFSSSWRVERGVFLHGDVIKNSKEFNFAKTVNITVKNLGLIDS